MNQAIRTFDAMKAEIAKLDTALEYPVTGSFEHLLEHAKASGLEMSGYSDPEDWHYVYEKSDGNMRTVCMYWLEAVEKSGDRCAHHVSMTLYDGDEAVEDVSRKFKGCIFEFDNYRVEA